MKSVLRIGLASVVGLALLAGGPTFGKGDKDKRKHRTNDPAATTEQKPDDQKPTDPKSAAQKPADPKSAATKPTEPKLAAQKSAAQKPAALNVAAHKGTDQKKPATLVASKAANAPATHTANKPVAPQGAMATHSEPQLPRGWAQLSLTDDQKQKVSGATQKYSAQIKRLEAQILQLKESQNAEMMMFLTPEQKTNLLKAEGVIKLPAAVAENSAKPQTPAASSTPNASEKAAPIKRIKKNRHRRNPGQQQTQAEQKSSSQKPSASQPSQQPNAKSDKK